MTETDPAVFVVDDDPSVRKALGRLLKAEGFRVELFASAEEFLARPPADGPACAVLDVQLPGLGGLDLQRALTVRGGGLPVVFVTGHGDIPMTVRAMKSGAADFLPKPVAARDLLAAVGHAVARHARTLREDGELADIRRRAEALSPREREVLALVVRGMLNKQVGRHLGVTEKTVKAHRAQVMHKMGADSLADLVRMASRLGIEPVPTPVEPGPFRPAVAAVRAPAP
jgi:FixJ family two-component response regulator